MASEMIVHIVPNWKNEFNVSACKIVEGEEHTFSLGTVNKDKLWDIMSQLSMEAETQDIKTYVFAYYHGSTKLKELYWQLMERFDKGNLHFEFEWG
jgi:hypothetical protein